MSRAGDTWDEVGAGVLRRRYASLDQNIALIITDEGLIVVDSRSNHPDADELLRDIALVSRSPIRYLVNTHFHWDHTFGNARFPTAEILGHTRCREVMIADGERTLTELAKADWVPADKRALFGEVTITPPTVTFRNALDLHLGGRDVRLWHPGLGHTDSDIVVLVDDVVMAGDLVEEGAPPSFGDSFPRAWVETLGVLADSITGAVVPGHGDIVDKAFVLTQRDEMSAAIAHLDDGDEPSPYPEAVNETIEARLAVSTP
ncbi:MAG TPA: MBL fold metallo-hydrolase [Acidimicrobiia bacterium]|nr:MBL fold metallo-hydrolase [Acidimicrobiia bacterium]